MPLLSRRNMDVDRPLFTARTAEPLEAAPMGLLVPSSSRLFETCANPGCRTGWMHLWRRRSAPVFEGAIIYLADCDAKSYCIILDRCRDH
jgi:hypothetical protein